MQKGGKKEMKKRSLNDKIKKAFKFAAFIILIIAILTTVYYLLDKNTGEEYKLDLTDISEQPVITSSPSLNK